MEKNRNLFEEAIADAKAIKEMAIANAKAALEESFTPHLQKMLSTKLQEMEKEEVEENIDETKDEDLYEMETDADKVEEAEEVEEELNLEELLAELDETEVTEEKDDLEKALNEAEDEEAEETEETEEAEDEEADDNMNLEDMSEEDLKKFIEDVIKDMVAAGDLEAGHEGMENEEGAEKAEVEDKEEEINIDEILEEIGVYEAKKADKEKAKKEDEKLKKELKEAINTIETLRSELQEINLLNAKLLYTNKIFRSKNLTEDKKIKVLSSFDKATTIKETKLVYETILESLKEKKTTPITESISRASKPTGTSTGKVKPILESNDLVSRFQKLAGII